MPIADIGSHWCDLVQFITGDKIVRVCADLVTVHPVRKKPKIDIDAFAGKTLTPKDVDDQPIDTDDYASVLYEIDSGDARQFHGQPGRGRAEESAVVRD